jgi:hypothetical protein
LATIYTVANKIGKGKGNAIGGILAFSSNVFDPTGSTDNRTYIKQSVSASKLEKF